MANSARADSIGLLPLSRLVRDFCIARYFEASQELDVAGMIVPALISAHRFVLRWELSPFLHQIVARCSLVLKTGLLRHVRHVRRLTTGADIEVRDLVGGDQLGSRTVRTNCAPPKDACRRASALYPLMRAALLTANAGDARTAKATTTPVVAFRDIS